MSSESLGYGLLIVGLVMVVLAGGPMGLHIVDLSNGQGKMAQMVAALEIAAGKHGRGRQLFFLASLPVIFVGFVVACVGMAMT